MKVASDDKVPPKPAMIETRAIRSRGPGFPANRVPKLPAKVQARRLAMKVPSGNPGLQ